MSIADIDYESLRARVEAALRTVFPQDTIVLREGYKGRVHVMVVSEKFNGMSEEEKRARVRDILEHHLKEDAQGVSLVIPYATEEL